MSIRLLAVGDVLLWTRNNTMPFDRVQHELRQRPALREPETVLS